MFKNTFFTGLIAATVTVGSLSFAAAETVSVGGVDFDIDNSVDTLTSTGAGFEYDFFGLSNVFVGSAAFDGSALTGEVDLSFGIFTIFDDLGGARDELGFSDVVADGTSVTAVFEVIGASSGDYDNGGILKLFDFSPVVGTDDVDILAALDSELAASGEFSLPVTASISVQSLAPIGVVPLPAGGFLLLTALGGLALRRRMTA